MNLKYIVRDALTINDAISIVLHRLPMPVRVISVEYPDEDKDKTFWTVMVKMKDKKKG